MKRVVTKGLGFLLACSALGGCSEDKLRALSETTEQFTQNAAAKIDVLWVVDNSNSMGEEQEGLGESFTAFINNLVASNIDYRIGVVSTDPADGGILNTGSSNVPVISNTTPNASSIFLENVSVGTSGSPDERAFEVMSMAMGVGPGWRPGDPITPPNSDFIRDEASLFVVVVSDEDDESLGPVGYYRRLIEAYKGVGNEALLSVSAIASPPGEPPCFQAEIGAAQGSGDRLARLASETGGVFASICEDFSETLARLSNNAAGLDSVFELSGVPRVAGSTVPCPPLSAREPFCVEVQEVGAPAAVAVPRDILSGWEFDEERIAIVFGVDAIPGPNATITVQYNNAVNTSTGAEQ